MTILTSAAILLSVSSALARAPHYDPGTPGYVVQKSAETVKLTHGHSWYLDDETGHNPQDHHH